MALITLNTSPIIFTLYNTIAINSYGLCIAIGALIGYYLLERDVVIKKIMSPEKLSSVAIFIIVTAVFGGRLLWCLENPAYLNNFFMFWHGGFSITGTISTVALLLPLYLKYKEHVSIVTFLDRLVIYAPLIQAISRVGCFLAGCCHGINTALPWAVIYTNQACAAPTGLPIHATQLYSSLALFIIFIGLYTQNHKVNKPGTLVAFYLILAGAERFFVDFLRADRTLIMSNFSFIQAVSCGLIVTGFLWWYVVSYAYTRQQ